MNADSYGSDTVAVSKLILHEQAHVDVRLFYT